MKSKLFKAVFGIGLFALALNVNANTINSVTDGSNTTDATVTVGEVAVPVYEVYVSWNDLTFDWTYDYETEKFGWKPADVCLPQGIENSDEFDNFDEHYTDENCTTEATEYTEGTEYYGIQEREAAEIFVVDASENGQIVPSIKYNSSSKYEDVVGKFKYRGETCLALEDEDAFSELIINKKAYIYSDSSCSSEVTTTPTFEAGKYYVLAYRDLDLASEELPDTARYGTTGTCYYYEEEQFCFPFGNDLNEYWLRFNLEGGTTTPTAGEEIGTITVSIRAK